MWGGRSLGKLKVRVEIGKEIRDGMGRDGKGRCFYDGLIVFFVGVVCLFVFDLVLG